MTTTKIEARKARYAEHGIPFVNLDDVIAGMPTGLVDSAGHSICEGDVVSLANNVTADDSMGPLPNGWFFDEADQYRVIYDQRIYTWSLETTADLADPTDCKWLNHAVQLLHEGRSLLVGKQVAA